MIYRYDATRPSEDIIREIQAGCGGLKGNVSKILRSFLNNPELRAYLTADNRKQIEVEFKDLGAIATIKCIFTVGVKTSVSGRTLAQIIIEDNVQTGTPNIALVCKAENDMMVKDLYRVASLCELKFVSMFYFGDSVRLSTNSIVGLEEILDVFESMAHSYRVGGPTYRKTFVGAGVFNG